MSRDPIYDNHNIFARILRSEIPCNKVMETPFLLAFHDVQPVAPVHVLAIPKGPYVHASHFLSQASQEEILGFWGALPRLVETLSLQHKGLRFVMNQGTDGGQEVPHFHVHLLGGEPVGPLRAQG